MNLLVSYFEIDGQIIELDTIENPTVVDVPESALEASMRLHEREMIAYELTGDPNTLHIKDEDYADVMRERGLDMMKEGHRRRQRKLGATIMRWSVGGALVPDPLPLVDEILFGTAFTVGALLYVTA